MSGIRTIEKQFEAPVAQRIRYLIEQVSILRRSSPRGATPYYFYELSTTLEAGALLASVHLASIALELFVRELVIECVSHADVKKQTSIEDFTYQERLEEDRGLGFPKLIDHLVAVGLFEQADSELAKKYYQEVRTPLAHGLTSRLVNGRPKESHNLFRIFGPSGLGVEKIENFIEHKALELIEVAVGIMRRNSRG